MVVVFHISVNDHDTMTSSSHYYPYSSHNKSKIIFGHGSHDPKYYDQIITKLNLQARERHERSLLPDQTASSNRNKKKRILLVDDEHDICMFTKWC